MSESLPILIIGAGVAGPALALSLHQKGYKVILFEKYDAPSTTGSSLCLAPNGLRVLGSLGLAEGLFTRNIAVPIERLVFRTDTEPGILASSHIPSVLPKHYGFPFAGAKRSVFLEYLLEAVQAQRIEVRYGHSLATLHDSEDSVTAVFENGQEVRGSFLVGCDGLHSQTRTALFGKDVAEYTGLTQTAGLSLVPGRFRHMQNVYGDNVHLISYVIGVKSLNVPESGTHDDITLISWACTRPEKEARETWKADEGDDFRTNVASQLNWDWEDGISGKDLVERSPSVTKFGLYDRKELNSWHKGRTILIGDAAHPTAPHLGQGANQALEDVALLSSLLVSQIPPSEGRSPDTDTLTKIFDAIDAQRIPRTSDLVRGARAAGQQRVLPSRSKEAEERNRNTKADWSQDEAKLLEKYQITLGPRLGA